MKLSEKRPFLQTENQRKLLLMDSFADRVLLVSFYLLIGILAVIELVPDNDFSFFEGFLDIYDPLVGRASELQHEVAFALIIAPIDQNINQRKQF